MLGRIGQSAIGLLMTCLLVEGGASQELPSLDHPGMRAFYAADSYYRAERYEPALRYYLQASAWGHKASQFNVGAMYFNGHGVDKDRATAWAWFELAAEREYPQMVDVAGNTWAELGEEERRKALARLELLRSEYADEITLPRLKRSIDRRNRSATGSRLPGAGSSPVLVISSQGWTLTADSLYGDRLVEVDGLIAADKAWLNSLAQPRVQVRDIQDDETQD